MKRMNFVIACLRPSQNVKLGIFMGSRAVDGQRNVQNSVMHVQSCRFALSSYCLFDFLVATISQTSYYLQYLLIRQNQNILGGNSRIAPADSTPNIFSIHR